MAKKKTYVVKSAFRDAAEFVKEGSQPTTYAVGQDVSNMDAERLKSLEERGLVEVKGADEDDK